jgi:hypothetical protein
LDWKKLHTIMIITKKMYEKMLIADKEPNNNPSEKEHWEKFQRNYRINFDSL